VTLLIVAILFRPFGFIAPKTLIYLAFQSFDFESTLMNAIPETVVMTLNVISNVIDYIYEVIVM
jgi:hypothetical protein